MPASAHTAMLRLATDDETYCFLMSRSYPCFVPERWAFRCRFLLEGDETAAYSACYHESENESEGSESDVED